MSGILSYVPVAGRLVVSSSKPRAINLPSVEVHPIETNPDRRARCLKHLLKANHVNYAIVCHGNNSLSLTNHTAHLLSTAYILGASEARLHAIYESQAQKLESWRPSPAEIVDLDWMDFLGDRRFQKAYVDFFEDKLAMRFSYNWKQELEHFLFTGEKPLLHGLLSGLGDPLIHLGCAYEIDSKEIAIEALGLACIEYDFLHKYTSSASYTGPSPLASDSPLLELLISMSDDERLKGLPKKPDVGELEALFDKHEGLIMEYWNAWDMADPLKQFQQSQEAAVALLVTTFTSGARPYSLLFAQLLAASHAVRVLLPFFPVQHHVTLVRQWWLLAITVFIMKGRPRPDSDNVGKEIGSKNWAYVERTALESEWSKDAHYIKAIRTMREASRTWGDAQGRYLQAAVTFVDHFGGWAF